VRSTVQGGKQLADLIAHKITHSVVSEIELFEILCDYLNKPAFRNYYTSLDPRDGYPLRELADIRALWDIVPKLPEAISYLLIENLPVTIAREAVLPNTMLKELNNRQIEKLLYRPDVGLEEFRKEIFWKTEASDFLTLIAASAYNFNLTYEEFAQILVKPKDERIEMLSHLSAAKDLSFYLYEAVHDALLASDENYIFLPWRKAVFPPNVEARLSALQGLQEFSGAQTREFYELRDLGLYRLAKAAVRWGKGTWSYPLKDELGFLSSEVVENDEWTTFLAFRQACERDPYLGIQWLSEFLPEWGMPAENSEQVLNSLSPPNPEKLPERDPSAIEGTEELKTAEISLSKEIFQFVMKLVVLIAALFIAHNTIFAGWPDWAIIVVLLLGVILWNLQKLTHQRESRDKGERGVPVQSRVRGRP
jgi:hypothetical protein